MTDDTIELKPCPFCGPQDNQDYQPSLRETRCLIHDYRIGCEVFCVVCGITLHEEYKDDVIEAWNTRSAMPQQEVTVKDAAKVLLEQCGRVRSGRLDAAKPQDYLFTCLDCDALRAISEGE